ncbi:transmembrane and coiled-coil domains protein 2-like [Ranitomeya imitator]|uniref:transmembrane and coiled-coil domains protein 2-like n=1 Tax=Ranitomeya imitator TaxID=111125 RepID=UPI0037E96090
MKSYFMQKMLDLSGQLPTEETIELENKADYLHVLPNAYQYQDSQVQPELEKVNNPMDVEIAHLEVRQEKPMEQEEVYLNNKISKINKAVDEEDVDLKSVDGLQNPSTQLTSSEGTLSDTVQDKVSYTHDKESSLTVIQSPALPNLVGGTPISGPLDRKCCNNETLMKEITAVKNRQDFLENECLQLSSRYTDNNIIRELLREQHLRYNQLLVNMNDLQEQQNAEMENMKEVIFFMEENIAYQCTEHSRDIWDEMGLFHSRLSKIETEQKQNSSSLGKDASCQVKNLLPTLLTNISQILFCKVMMICLTVTVIVLLTCLCAVSISFIPFNTPAIYITLTLTLVYGVLKHWSAVSDTLRRSWPVAHAMHLINRLINNYNFSSALEEAWELLIEG